MKGRIFIVLICIFILAGCKITTEYDIVISNINLFDGQNERGQVNLAINADTIAAISSNSLKAKTYINGSDKYVIPGLVNAHAHAWKTEQLEEAFESGILASFDLYQAWPMSERGPVDLRSLKDSLGFANYHSTGPAATVKGGHASNERFGYEHPANYPFLSDSLNANQFVERSIKEGAEMIKIIRQPFHIKGDTLAPLPTLSYKQIKNIIDYAKTKNLKTIVHILHSSDAKRVSKLRPDGLAHMWHDKTPLSSSELDIIKKSGVFIIPTLMLEKKANERLINDTTLSQKRIAFEKAYFMYPDSVFHNRLKQVFDAGIPIIAGTDPPNAGINFGTDFIEELLIYHEAGIPNIEVLKSATGNAAKYLPVEGVGRIKIGGPASFLILNKNPLDDLNALSDIKEIWKNGKRAITKR